MSVKRSGHTHLSLSQSCDYFIQKLFLLKSLPYLRPRNVIFHMPVSRPGLLNPYPFPDLASEKLCHYYQIRTAKRDFLKFISSSHITPSLLGIETANTFIHPVVPSKTIPDSRSKWEESFPVLRPKGRKNYTLWGCIYLYG